MMINCEESSKLISKKKDQALSFKEKIALKIHNLICSACALFETEVDLISDAVKRTELNIPKLTDEKKAMIQEKINSDAKKLL